jgi:2-oxoacid:acceptor oxidoreductase delta subunit (pyruvate/2-ketoisovalerate family)
MSKEYIGPVGEGLYAVKTGDWRTRRPVLDQKKCKKCGICLMYCPVNAVRREADGSFHIGLDYCKGCGVCAAECPAKAIEMEKEGPK